MSFKACVSLLIFCLDDLSIDVSAVLKYSIIGVPVVEQWLVNPTRNHEVVGSIPGLAQ